MNYVRAFDELKRVGLNKAGDYELRQAVINPDGAWKLNILAEPSTTAIVWDVELVSASGDDFEVEIKLEDKVLDGNPEDDEICEEKLRMCQTSERGRLRFFSRSPFLLKNSNQDRRCKLSLLVVGFAGPTHVKYSKLTLFPQNRRWPSETSGLGIHVDDDHRLYVKSGEQRFISAYQVRHGDFACDRCGQNPLSGPMFEGTEIYFGDSFDLCSTCYRLNPRQSGENGQDLAFRRIHFEDEFEEMVLSRQGVDGRIDFDPSSNFVLLRNQE